MRINTTDGLIINSTSCNFLRLTENSFQTSISCSSNTESICYFIVRNSSDENDQKACQVDFSSGVTNPYATLNSSDYRLSSIAALNDTHVIVAGFEAVTTPGKYFFHNLDFPNNATIWAVESTATEDIYSTSTYWRSSTFLNNDSSKLITVMQVEQAPIVIVLNPTDGTLIDARKVEYGLNNTSGLLQASGRISNNAIMISFSFSTQYSPLVFINTDTWDLTSYSSNVFNVPSGFTPLFSTDQIVLLIQTNTPDFFTLQAAYDKLNTTELFSEATYNLTNITGDLNFTAASVGFSISSDSNTSWAPTLSDPTFTTDSSKTYEVTANIFSSNVATLNGDITSSSLGPVEFDCYSVATSASSADFSNQLSMTQSDGQAIPSWMSIDSSSATVVLSSPEVSLGDYIVTSSFTGIAANFTFDTNVTINIGPPSEDHCLGASSEGLCGFFVTLIIFGIVIPVIFISVLIYIKYKPHEGTNDMTKLDQEHPDEGNGNDDNAEGDESVGMNQNNQAEPNMGNGTVQHAEHDDEENQV